MPPDIDGVRVQPAADGRTWLVTAGRPELAIIPPASGWVQFPSAVHAAVFTDGGPEAWSPQPGALAVIEVASQSRDGLPARAFLQDLGGMTVLRTDRLGTVELVASGSRFVPP
jgi:hypothetical protein